MAEQSPNPDGNAGAKPEWLAPAIVVGIVVALVVAGKKNKAAIENPLVDFAVLTVGVFAFAAAFRFIATKLGSNGMAQFFGAPASSAQNAK